MIALREGASKLGHEHFHSGIAEGMLSISFLGVGLLMEMQCKVRRRTIFNISLDFGLVLGSVDSPYLRRPLLLHRFRNSIVKPKGSMGWIATHICWIHNIHQDSHLFFG